MVAVAILAVTVGVCLALFLGSLIYAVIVANRAQMERRRFWHLDD